jgi:molybdopterin-guanine dinucleotide biosynthesis protein A
VAADGQQLPKLDNRVTVVPDRRPDRGPLEGLAAGLQAIADQADAAFVTSCDAPLLAPRLIARLGELLRDYEGVVPRHDGMVQPLTALYRASVLAQVEAMLASNELGVHRLLKRIDALVVDANELRDVDPQLLSFRGCNTPDEYQAALGIAGLVD